jgi:hypothetical protein
LLVIRSIIEPLLSLSHKKFEDSICVGLVARLHGVTDHDPEADQEVEAFSKDKDAVPWQAEES